MEGELGGMAKGKPTSPDTPLRAKGTVAENDGRMYQISHGLQAYSATAKLSASG